jgi:hypothetical protein
MATATIIDNLHLTHPALVRSTKVIWNDMKAELEQANLAVANATAIASETARRLGYHFPCVSGFLAVPMEGLRPDVKVFKQRFSDPSEALFVGLHLQHPPRGGPNKLAHFFAWHRGDQKEAQHHILQWQERLPPIPPHGPPPWP